MEISKIINKSKKLPISLEEAFKKDLDTIINNLLSEFDICHKGTKNKINKEILINKLSSSLKINSNNCCAVTKNGNKCSKKTIDENSKYCYNHIKNDSIERITQNEDFYLIKNNEDNLNKLDKSDTLNYIKKYIDDSFYLIDDKFIYEQETLEKVGYIDNNEFILTSDPFILNCI